MNTFITTRPGSIAREPRCRDERGTTTAEYAIGTLAACAFAAVLYKILTGGAVASALGGLVHRALGVAG